MLVKAMALSSQSINPTRGQATFQPQHGKTAAEKLSDAPSSSGKRVRGGKRYCLASRASACVMRPTFAIFIVFRALRSKGLVFVDRLYIRHFRRFRQDPCSWKGHKTLLPKSVVSSSQEVTHSKHRAQRPRDMASICRSEDASLRSGQARPQQRPFDIVLSSPRCNSGEPLI